MLYRFKFTGEKIADVIFYLWCLRYGRSSVATDSNAHSLQIIARSIIIEVFASWICHCTWRSLRYCVERKNIGNVTKALYMYLRRVGYCACCFYTLDKLKRLHFSVSMFQFIFVEAGHCYP